MGVHSGVRRGHGVLRVCRSGVPARRGVHAVVDMNVADVALLMTPIILAGAIGRLWWLFKDLVWAS